MYDFLLAGVLMSGSFNGLGLLPPRTGLGPSHPCKINGVLFFPTRITFYLGLDEFLVDLKANEPFFEAVGLN